MFVTIRRKVLNEKKKRLIIPDAYKYDFYLSERYRETWGFGRIISKDVFIVSIYESEFLNCSIKEILEFLVECTKEKVNELLSDEKERFIESDSFYKKLYYEKMLNIYDKEELEIDKRHFAEEVERVRPKYYKTCRKCNKRKLVKDFGFDEEKIDLKDICMQCAAELYENYKSMF